MLKVELVPDLDHCIETVAKQEYAVVLKKLLAHGEDNKEMEEKSEILRLFLENTDFKKIRAASEKQFVEGKRVRFLVFLENGILKYEMEIITT